VVPVGSHEELPVNVRVLAATNRDLAVEVNEGRFREDLFYRLNVVAIRTMPLRDRPEDVPVLAHRYLSQLAARHGGVLVRINAREADGPPGTIAIEAGAREALEAIERAMSAAAGRPDA
jgi:transcriptional regulator with GAF, ATPase, and Fis domain